MRIIGNIPHPTFHISVYEWNGKTIIKLEAGPMEQVYKFSTDVIRGVEGSVKILSPEFYDKIHDRFNQMFLDMEEATKGMG